MEDIFSYHTRLFYRLNCVCVYDNVVIDFSVFLFIVISPSGLWTIKKGKDKFVRLINEVLNICFVEFIAEEINESLNEWIGEQVGHPIFCIHQ